MTDDDKSETKSTPDGLGLDYRQIRAMVTELATAIAWAKVPQDVPEQDPKVYAPGYDQIALRADYQSTVDVIKLLSDIRFRCLVFVTAITAVANAVLPATVAPGTRIALGAVGFFTTFGIAVYELRNSQLYEAAIHRAKVLETGLKVLRASGKSARAGLFNERPLYVEEEYGECLCPEHWQHPKKYDVRLMRFLFVKVKHDQGLAMIYGAVLGAWVYLMADGVRLILAAKDYWPKAHPGWSEIIVALLGASAFLIARQSFVYHDNHRFRPSEPSQDQNESGLESHSPSLETPAEQGQAFAEVSGNRRVRSNNDM
jgi:hypothetical protein